MNESKISVRYARALFLSAREHGLVDEIRGDMETILDMAKLEDVKDILDSPVIENSRKGTILTAILKGRIQNLTFNLVLICVSNNREIYLPGIARCYINEADRYNGITRVELTTAVPVTANIRNNIRSIIEINLNTKAEIQETIDPKITGGFILKVDDLFLDASIRAGLRKIKKEFTTE